MDDKRIIELYFARSEDAIAETQKKYGSFCYSVAKSILPTVSDAEECVNDAYLGVWNSIPPNNPRSFSAYIGRIVRNISLNRYASLTAEKRSPQMEAVYDEVEEFIPDTSGEISEDIHLRQAINGFLLSLTARRRKVFLQRYWYMCSISEIATSMGMTEGGVKVMLMRTRERFKAYLEKEGITL